MITGVVVAVIRPACVLVLVVFVGLVWLIALAFGESRREYALAVGAKGVDLARVLLGPVVARRR